jgi:hypothetical protein
MITLYILKMIRPTRIAEKSFILSKNTNNKYLHDAKIQPNYWSASIKLKQLPECVKVKNYYIPSSTLLVFRDKNNLFTLFNQLKLNNINGLPDIKTVNILSDLNTINLKLFKSFDNKMNYTEINDINLKLLSKNSFSNIFYIDHFYLYENKSKYLDLILKGNLCINQLTNDELKTILISNFLL